MTTQRRLFGAAYETKQKEQQNGGKKEESKNENAIHSQRRRSCRRRWLVRIPGKDLVVEHCADEELMELSKQQKRII